MNVEEVIIAIVKFGEKEYMQELLNGRLYTRRLKYYRYYEKKFSDKSRGDVDEGAQILNDVEFYCINPKNGLTMFSGKGKAKIICDELDKRPIFCSCCILKKDLELIKKDKEYNTYRLNFSRILGEAFDESYWDTGVVIEPNYFFERIKTCCEKEDIVLSGEKIIYYDNKMNLQDLNKSVEDNSKNIVFWKDYAYEKQKEHRILFENISLENNGDNFTLDIGSLDGHSIMFTKKQLKETTLKILIKNDI
ncbi:hypothetical protein [Clostridium vincentii]|uniref:Uncharacterized protein n=1 Tax=Clostridium vincentii TaxID=52704 RepID=A0A2T0BH00_9CLOT|nr:hypothetical protein [Clostridium vincentii]PRR83107.1 hypothetical protein CLVI_11420 [Clostridium vincentii]